MDIKMLDYVVMIAKCESISKAAEKLYLTQSGLNQQLLKLERNLGIKLFERDHHHFRITDAGKIYVRNAMEILRIQRNTLMQLSDLKNNIHAEISIGLTHEHGIDLFTAVYPIFRHHYPYLRCKLAEHIVRDQYQLIEEGELDIGIVLTNINTAKCFPDLVFHEVYQEDLLLGIPMTHPMAKNAVPIGTAQPLRVTDIHLFKDEPFSLILRILPCARKLLILCLRKINCILSLCLKRQSIQHSHKLWVRGFPVQSSRILVSYLVHIAMIVHGFACLIIPCGVSLSSTGKTINSANQYMILSV